MYISVMRKRYLLVVALLPFLLIGCGGSNNDSQDPLLQTRLVLQDVFSQESNRFAQGETITLSLTLTNYSDEAVTLNFTSGQQYDFYVVSNQGAEIWRWSGDRAFTDALTELLVPGKESIEVEVIWDQTLLIEQQLPIGDYIAFGSFLDQSPVAEVGFTIQ